MCVSSIGMFCFGLALVAVNEEYICGTWAISFLLCNTVEDGPLGGAIYYLSKKLQMCSIVFILWASFSPLTAFHDL